MADIKTLGVQLEVRGGQQAKSELNGFSSAAGQAEASVEKLGRNLKGQFTAGAQSASASLKSLGATMSIALSAPVLLAGNSFFKLSNTIDSATVALGRMLKSTVVAKDVLSQVKALADKSPFEFPGLIQTTQQLIGFKVNSNELVSVLSMLGNAAGGSQEKLERLANAYGKTSVKGRATMEELNMFLEAGVPILDELAVGFKTNTKNIYKMVESGKVGFDDVNAALKRLTTGSGQFAGIIDEQAKTVGGILSTLKDKINDVGVSIIKSFEPAIRAVIGAISDSLDWFMSLDEGTRKILSVILLIGAAIGPVILVFGQFAGALRNIAAVFQVARIAAIAFQATLMTNPIFLLIGALTAMAVAIYGISQAYDTQAEAERKLQKAHDDRMAADTGTLKMNNESSAFIKGQIETLEKRYQGTRRVAEAQKLLNFYLDQRENYEKMPQDGGTETIIKGINQMITGYTQYIQLEKARQERRSPAGGGGSGVPTLVAKDTLGDLENSFTNANAELENFDSILTESLFNTLDGTNQNLMATTDITDELTLAAVNAALAIQKMDEEIGKSARDAQAFNAVVAKLGAQFTSGAINAGIEGFGELGKAMGEGKNMSDSFNAALTSMASSILKMLPMLFVQAGLQLIASGQWALGLGFIAAGASSAVVGGFVEGRKSKASAGETTSSASGNVFTAGIIDKTTKFASGGTLNKAGENNAEAILPLKRDATGRLGVVSDGGGGSNVEVNIFNNTNSNVEQKESTDEKGNKKIDVYIREVVSNQISAGAYNKELRSQFKLQSQGV